MSEHPGLAGIFEGDVAYAQGYPKIPNVATTRAEHDKEALEAMDTAKMGLTEPSNPFTLWKSLKEDENVQFSAAFTIPILYTRIRNLEAQVIAGWEQTAHWEREARALAERANVHFVHDRTPKGNPGMRLRVVKTGTLMDTKCYGLPTTITLQVFDNWDDRIVRGSEERVFEGKYVLLENHLGDVSITQAAQGLMAWGKVLQSLDLRVPAPFDPHEVAAMVLHRVQDGQEARGILRQTRDHVLPQVETELKAAFDALGRLKAGKAPATNMQAIRESLTTLRTLTSAMIDSMVEEDLAADEAPSL